MQTENVDAAVLFDAVLEKVAEVFSQGLQQNVKVTQITPFARRVWTESWMPINHRQPPNGGWDWLYKYQASEKKYRKYLMGIAIWESSKLCGLALCSRSRGGDNLSIHYIEGSPDNSHPLKGMIFSIVDNICQEYAMQTEVKSIRVLEPVDDLVDFYKSYGYELKNKRLFGSKYCERGIKL
jgi:hypothetical protein